MMRKKSDGIAIIIGAVLVGIIAGAFLYDEVEIPNNEKEVVVEKIELNSNDEGFINEDRDIGVRIRDNEFIIGVPYSDAVQLWLIEETDEVNVYKMVDDEERMNNPSPEAMNEYVPVDEAYPNGLTYKVISNEEVEVYHGKELLDTFKIDTEGGR